MSSAAVPDVVEFDAQLPPSGEPVGEGDEAALVAVDLDVRPHVPGVAYARMVVRAGPTPPGAAGRPCRGP
ncbi:hypothetical protein LUX09_01025 [Streptomyces albogriseolus]|nr:hypothetical protein [Streptomyces albogriseolus]